MNDAKRKAKNLLVCYFNEVAANGLTLAEHDEIETIVDLIIEAAVKTIKLEQASNLTTA